MSEQQELDGRKSSRRAVLAAAVGGIGAWAAGALGRAAPVRAADGDVVNVGDDLTGSKTTSFTVNTQGFSALWGNSTATELVSVGVRGDSGSGHQDAAGVLGIASNAVGVRGSGLVGVRGNGASAGVSGISPSGRGVSGYSPSGFGVVGETATGYAVLALGASGTGIYGMNDVPNRPAIVGRSDGAGTGVQGFAGGGESQPPPKPKTGVYGQSTLDATSRGVWGISSAGQGVRGEASTGVAVAAVASSSYGYAIRSSGRVRFDKVCGIATLAAGTTSKVITPGTDVTADSFVLLTPGADIGTRRLWFTKDTTANTITIRLSSSMASATNISWLLLR